MIVANLIQNKSGPQHRTCYCLCVLTRSVTSGLIGWYSAESYIASTGQWRDLSGCGNDATATPASAVQVQSSGGQSYVQGSRTSNVTFPRAILPPSYTLFHVARYAGNATGRIVTTTLPLSPINSYSGFHGGVTGVAYHAPGPGLIQKSPVLANGEWLLSSDQLNKYRAQGVERRETFFTTAPNGMAIPLCINCWAAEASDWAVAALLVFSYELSEAETVAMEDHLADVYGLTLHRATASSPPGPTPPGEGGGPLQHHSCTYAAAHWARLHSSQPG